MINLRQCRKFEAEALPGGGRIEVLERLQRQPRAIALIDRQPGLGVGALPQARKELPAAIHCQPGLHPRKGYRSTARSASAYDGGITNSRFSVSAAMASRSPSRPNPDSLTPP